MVYFQFFTCISNSPCKIFKRKGKIEARKKLEFKVYDLTEPRNHMHSHLPPVWVICLSIVSVIMSKASLQQPMLQGLHNLTPSQCRQNLLIIKLYRMQRLLCCLAI